MKSLTIASVSLLTVIAGVDPLRAEERSFESPYSLQGKISSHFEAGKVFFIHQDGSRLIHEARDPSGKRIAQMIIDPNGKKTLEAYLAGSSYPLAREFENEQGMRVTEVFDPKGRIPVIRETWTLKQSLSVEFFDENSGKLLGRCKTLKSEDETQLVAEIYDQKRQWVIKEKTIEKVSNHSKPNDSQHKSKDCHDLLSERIRISKNMHTNDPLTNTVVAISELPLESLNPHSSIDRHPSLSEVKKLKSRDTSHANPARRPSYSVIRVANE